MAAAYTVTGTLTDRQTVKLDEMLPLKSQKVRLIVEPIVSETKKPYQEGMKKIRERQKARGHQPPTRAEIDAYLKAERESWE